MKLNHPTPEEDLSRLIDGLVCGDLDEEARGRVLAWLDEDPPRWRLCGLAFLEAQTWSQTLGPWPAGAPVRETPLQSMLAGASPRPSGGDVAETRSEPAVLRGPKNLRQPAARRVLAAAAWLAAFGFGLVAREAVVPRDASRDRLIADNGAAATGAPATGAPATGGLPDNAAENEPVLAALDVRTGDGFGPTAPIRIPVVPAAGRPGHAQEIRSETEIPEYVRQQWERRGYKVSFERRFLFAQLPDGQQVAVPVDQVHVNPIPVSIN